jgi:hypothetical protein
MARRPIRDALQKTSFKGPAGEVKIDANRNGVGTTYITEVTKAPDGSFYNKVVKTVPNISQTLGLPEAEFKKMGLGLARRARLPQVGRAPMASITSLRPPPRGGRRSARESGLRRSPAHRPAAACCRAMRWCSPA